MFDVTIALCSANRPYLIIPLIHEFQRLSALYSEFTMELLIVDDSTDEDYSDLIAPVVDMYSNVRLVTNSVTKGLSSARNLSMRHANSEYWCFIDDDDWLEESFFLFITSCLADPRMECNIGLNEKRIKKITKFLGLRPGVNSIDCSLDTLFKMGFTPPVSYQLFSLQFLKSFSYDPRILSGVDHDLWISFYSKSPNFQIRIKQVINEARNYYDDGNRITKNYNQRLSNIKDSLIVWSERLGPDCAPFMTWLEREYINNTKEKQRLSKQRSYFLNLMSKLIYSIRTRNRIFKFSKWQNK